MMGSISFTNFILTLVTAFMLTHDSDGLIRRQEIAESKIREKRIEHVRELLGEDSERIEFISKQSRNRIEKQIASVLTDSLPKRFARLKPEIFRAVNTESLKYGWDPMFLMAIIENESQFNPYAIGSVGEIGLMQIRPRTARWISKKLGVKYDGKKDSLYRPEVNLRIGAAYIAYLQKKYKNNSHLYLSAYNMGPTMLHKTLKKNITPKIYMAKTMKNYVKYYRNLHVAQLERKLKNPGKTVSLAFMNQKRWVDASMSFPKSIKF